MNVVKITGAGSLSAVGTVVTAIFVPITRFGRTAVPLRPRTKLATPWWMKVQ